MPVAQVLFQHHCFGLNGNVNNNVIFINETVVIYPAANSVIIFNSETKIQKFIPLSDESDSISALAITPNKKILAVAERSNKGPSISLWDFQRMHKRKVFSIPENTCEEFTNLAFSPDNKMLLAQGGAPEWNMTIWMWEKSKIVSRISHFLGSNLCSFNTWQSLHDVYFTFDFKFHNL